MKSQRAFTLIELLVVIAIIGVLSAIILAALGTGKNKGNDAAVKSNLKTVTTQAGLLYDIDGDYDAVCAANGVTQNTVVAQAFTAAGVAGGAAGVCGKPASGVATNYAISVPLRVQNLFGASSGADHWCIDSAGKAKIIDNAIAATAVVCP